MLINEVLDSKSIALSATENASNQIPYLGLQWFPERKKQGLDLSWIKTHKGLPVSLAPSKSKRRVKQGKNTDGIFP